MASRSSASHEQHIIIILKFYIHLYSRTHARTPIESQLVLVIHTTHTAWPYYNTFYSHSHSYTAQHGWRSLRWLLSVRLRIFIPSCAYMYAFDERSNNNNTVVQRVQIYHTVEKYPFTILYYCILRSLSLYMCYVYTGVLCVLCTLYFWFGWVCGDSHCDDEDRDSLKGEERAPRYVSESKRTNERTNEREATTITAATSAAWAAGSRQQTAHK